MGIRNFTSISINEHRIEKQNGTENRNEEPQRQLRFGDYIVVYDVTRFLHLFSILNFTIESRLHRVYSFFFLFFFWVLLSFDQRKMEEDEEKGNLVFVVFLMSFCDFFIRGEQMY